MKSLNRHSAAGFTLLELMVVVVVIGIIVGIFSLSVGSFLDDNGREDMRRLQVLIDLALEEASMQGRDIGLQFYQHGYEFSARESFLDKEGNKVWQWVPLDKDRLLRPRDLGEDISVDLELEDKEITLKYERETDETYLPQVFLLSNGDVEPPFTVRLKPGFSAEELELNVEADGTIEEVINEY